MNWAVIQAPNLDFERLPLLPLSNTGVLMSCDRAVVGGDEGIMCTGSNRAGGDQKQMMFMPLEKDVQGNWQVNKIQILVPRTQVKITFNNEFRW